MRMPSLAATPPPTITAVGVARPSAHGHAMTTTAHPNMKASSCPFLRPQCVTHMRGTASMATAVAHTAHVRAASITTTGTK